MNENAFLSDDFEYIVIDDGCEYPGDAVRFKPSISSTIGGLDLCSIAEDAASDFNSEDGWECEWPKTFEIFVRGVSKGKFSVERYTEPNFRAKVLS